MHSLAFSKLGEGASAEADEVVLTVCRCLKVEQKPTTTSSPPAGGASPSLEKPRRKGFHNCDIHALLCITQRLRSFAVKKPSVPSVFGQKVYSPLSLLIFPISKGQSEKSVLLKRNLSTTPSFSSRSTVQVE